jgi:hypothetical protein
METYSLNEVQFERGYSEWKLLNEETIFTDSRHLKNSLGVYIKNNSEELSGFFPPKKYEKSTLKDNWW